MKVRSAVICLSSFLVACGQTETPFQISGTGGKASGGETFGSGGDSTVSGTVGGGGSSMGGSRGGGETGGTVGMGNAPGTGGYSVSGGWSTIGSPNAGGGIVSEGGTVAVDGAFSNGGLTFAGGAFATGGLVDAGGIVSGGGILSSGGIPAVGGSASSGGTGAGGKQANGGISGTGGDTLDASASVNDACLDDGLAVQAETSSSGASMDVGENVEPTLNLVAGALGGEGMQDGTGPVARFYDPTGLSSDGKGHLFVADQFNYTIRKIDLATGVVSTLAGTPGAVGSGDGIGTSASFDTPSGVAYDGVGNLLVADADNHLIRIIDLSTGVVGTLAGSTKISGSADGAGMSAQFYYPRGVACDGLGNVFVADAFNHTIRKVVISTGEVSTLAGTAKASGSADGNGAAARFNYPGALLFDGAGGLFVADTRNNTIRKIVLSTGAVTTLAGSAGTSGSADGVGTAARFNNPVGIGSDGAGSLFIADSFNHTIRKFVIATAAVTTLGGSAGTLGSADGTGSSARFNHPDGIASDGSGSLFVGDSSNHEIRRVVIATGAVTTFAGAIAHPGSTDAVGADARFFSPSRVVYDGADNLFVADEINTAIRKIVISTGAVTTFVGSANNSGAADGIGAAASFGYLMGLATDGAGNLFVSDSSGCTIRKVVIATRAVTTIAGLAGSKGSADGTGSDARFYYPSDLTADQAGNLFVADTFNHTIRKIVIATAAVTTLAGSAGSTGATDGTGTNARFNSPSGVTSDGAGSLFVADSKNHTLRKVVIFTGTVTTVAGVAGSPGFADGTGANALLNYPYSVTSDGSGGIYVGELNNHKVRKFALTSQALTTVVGAPGNLGVVLGPLPGGVNTPTGLAFAPPYGLFIVDQVENAILVARF